MLNGRNKTRIVKLEQARSARARRYVFHPDELAEAEAQGLPYVLLPRVLSRREWIERYGQQPSADPGDQRPYRPWVAEITVVDGSLNSAGLTGKR
jgi:hypothetical protein